MNVDWSWIADNVGRIASMLGQHVLLSLIPVAASFILAMPIGYLISRLGPVTNPILAVLGALYSVPSLALFVLIPAVVGTKILNPLNVVVALTIYSTALLSRSVVDGLREVPTDVQQSADALGYGRFRRLFGIELPLAMPVIFAGLRVATMANIALVSISIFIGVKSLGTLFDQGFGQVFLTPVYVGLVLSILVAIAADLVILAIRRSTLPWTEVETTT
jgi:osmoprotectant transport system permease protein